MSKKVVLVDPTMVPLSVMEEMKEVPESMQGTCKLDAFLSSSNEKVQVVNFAGFSLPRSRSIDFSLPESNLKFGITYSEPPRPASPSSPTTRKNLSSPSLLE